MLNGEIAIVAADMCEVLRLGDAFDGLSRLDDDKKGINAIDSRGSSQKTLTVNKHGLYGPVLSSHKQQARAFRRWVPREVILTIWPTGSDAAAPIAETETPAQALDD